ncbi:MAG: NUDIX hydrolase [Burkholderiales bacterium]|nr:NUDIX hydrolase [Burkholderiales bacterium]
MAKPPRFDSDFTETTHSTQLVYEGGLLEIRRDEVKLPDGHMAWREYVVHPGAVMILAFVDADTVILERQFRYPKHRHFIELPAGKLEAGERALSTAKRELIEECGFEAREWWKVATLDPCIGYSTEVIEVYGARGLHHVGAKLDAGEHLETFEARIEDALEWVRDGIITDTKTTLGLMWWARWGKFPGK